MKKNYKEHHLLKLLETYDRDKLPLDLTISQYFRANPALGSKDRLYIGNTAYMLIRWLLLIDFLAESEQPTWELRLDVSKKMDLPSIFSNPEIPSHIKYSFPEILWNFLVSSYGEEEAARICQASNRPAPTTIRVNPAKISRDNLMAKWEGLYDISPCKLSPLGIVFHKKINFFSLPEFKAGFFEVQDEGSQLLADLVAPKEGDLVMDYCCGSGGKTLAFAHKLKDKGQLFLHDIRPGILLECRRRLRRAGVQNAQIFQPDNPNMKKWKKKMDWVLVDAPCSGTGALRRNPDMKWKFNEETVPNLVGLQRTIFEKALSFMKPDGRIIYATCSILKQENEEQLKHFMQTYYLQLEGEPFASLPAPGEMDGFFGAVLKH